MFVSKLKQALICLKAGRVTLPYPYEPSPPPEGFRGKLKVDIDKCIGCAGCANVCPSRAIEVTDFGEGWRRIQFHLTRCISCGRCEEVCPEEAVKLTNQFELSTNAKEDLAVAIEVYMDTCQRCTRCFKPQHPLDKMMVTGFRE
ncbi:MAG: 4Fe-4S dicluster domain-containing protein [Phycisphaerae bacterium]